VQQTLTLSAVRGTAARTGQLLVTRVPVAKTTVVPINASQPGGRPLTYTVTSSNPKIMARVKTGNPYLKLTVSYAGDTNAAGFRGEMLLQLFRDMAPMTVGNIAGLAQAGFYDGLHFHRIVPGFVLQGGDPNSRDLTHPELWGQGGPGFTFDNEFNPSLIFTGRGQLAMANSGMPLLSATNGSQFFITTASPRHLDFKHTVFGQLEADLGERATLTAGVAYTNTQKSIDFRQTNSDVFAGLDLVQIGFAQIFGALTGKSFGDKFDRPRCPGCGVKFQMPEGMG
jgi:cyclophilin family peptidyl-prolyl cis-trans isomerase